MREWVFHGVGCYLRSLMGQSEVLRGGPAGGSFLLLMINALRESVFPRLGSPAYGLG